MWSSHARSRSTLLSFIPAKPAALSPVAKATKQRFEPPLSKVTDQRFEMQKIYIKKEPKAGLEPATLRLSVIRATRSTFIRSQLSVD